MPDEVALLLAAVRVVQGLCPGEAVPAARRAVTQSRPRGDAALGMDQGQASLTDLTYESLSGKDPAMIGVLTPAAVVDQDFFFSGRVSTYYSLSIRNRSIQTHSCPAAWCDRAGWDVIRLDMFR